MGILLFLMSVVAVEHLTDLLVNVDLLERKRTEFEIMFPSLSKLARCRFCQAFWICGIICILSPGLFGLGDEALSRIADIFLSWLVMHKAVVLLTEATDRFLGRAPSSHNVLLHLPSSESKSDS